MVRLRPPFPYFGGKQTLGPRIAALLPEHRHYVEPYCGSLAVLLSKEPAPFETVNDLDAELVTFWRVLRERPDELARVCALTPHSRAEYDLADDRTGGPADRDGGVMAECPLTELDETVCACPRHRGGHAPGEEPLETVGQPFEAASDGPCARHCTDGVLAGDTIARVADDWGYVHVPACPRGRL